MSYCYGCGNREAPAAAWFCVGNGPGGGHDPIWRVKAACDKCADETWGDWSRYPHVLPSTKDTRRA